MALRAYAALIDVKFCKWATAQPHRYLRSGEATASWSRQRAPSSVASCIEDDGRGNHLIGGSRCGQPVCQKSLWVRLEVNGFRRIEGMMI
jgi:hypothetical protein